MAKNRWLWLGICVLVLASVAVGCAQSTPVAMTPVVMTVIHTRVAEVPVTVVVTQFITVTVEVPVTVTPTPTPVNTPTPTNTPTITPTPTNTATPTPTPTPFSIARCRDLQIKLTATMTDEQIQTQFDSYHGQCVRLIFDPQYGDLATTDLMLYLTKLQLKEDAITPTGMKALEEYSSVWGIFLAAGQPPDNTTSDILLLRRVDVLPKNQAVIHDEGLYSVGKDGEMAPGVWKSALLSTDTGSCYWARINPDTGSIKANHFGVGGVSVRVYEGEVFETNDSCTPWYYVSP
jgi:hypothetical protein